VDLTGHRTLVIATNHGMLDIGKPIGVFARELAAAYNAFLDAGMGRCGEPSRGVIPVDPLSVKSIIRTAADDRLLADAVRRTKITNSLPIASVDINSYDIVYLVGGWGAAFDLGFSELLAIKITEANAADKIIGGVWHGPLGLINATAANGRPLVEGRHVTGVSNRRVRDLRITHTPQHPETELRRKGALYESQHSDLRCAGEPLAHRWQSDHRSEPEHRSYVAREMLRFARQRLTGRPEGSAVYRSNDPERTGSRRARTSPAGASAGSARSPAALRQRRR
jgi:putative intracellular protease/amidase